MLCHGNLSYRKQGAEVQGPLPCGMCHGSRARLAGTQGSVGHTAVETHQLLGLQKGRECGGWVLVNLGKLLKFKESGIGVTVEQRKITTH